MMANDKNPAKAVEPASANDYAFWKIPGTEVTVTYSLPLLHDIDFAVNEGYRKIPHGGIEVGGVLFGASDRNSVQIEAFREIECEHAAGPSFILSQRDLDALTAQLTAAWSDPALMGSQPIGWFLSHTRSSLQLTEREVSLFDRFFPGQGQLTLLVKPERFQPTRFGFLTRTPAGVLLTDASAAAIILPLRGRNSKPAPKQPMPAIPAPAVSPAAAPRSAELANQGSGPKQQSFESLEGSQGPARNSNDQSPANEAALDKPRGPTSGPLNLEPARETATSNEHPDPSPSMALVPLGDQSLVPTEKRAKRRRSDDRHFPYNPPLQLLKRNRVARSGLVLALPLAALLGCAVGYFAYLQMPAPVIPLSVRGLSQTVLVTWPAEETRNAAYAAVRVDDSAPVLLSPEEKAAGQVEVSASADMKVELIARNWLRDSHGIVRFIKANTLRQHTIP